MRVWVYDGSFDGLLSAIFDAYTGKAFPDALLRESDAVPLTAVDGRTVCTDAAKAARVFVGLKKRLSPDGVNDALYAWLAEREGGVMPLFRYIRKVFDSARRIERDFSDPDVLAVSRMAKKVSCELHQLAGFIRFQKTAENIYFAAIAPRYDVLPLLLEHFSDRLADQDWIVYDTVRHYGVALEQGVFRDVSLDERHLQQGALAASALADNEVLFQTLWQGYFKATAIQERINPKLQSRCMPRRFWAYLTEKHERA